MELGIYTFADAAEAVSGGALNAHRRIKELRSFIEFPLFGYNLKDYDALSVLPDFSNLT